MPTSDWLLQPFVVSGWNPAAPPWKGADALDIFQDNHMVKLWKSSLLHFHAYNVLLLVISKHSSAADYSTRGIIAHVHIF